MIIMIMLVPLKTTNDTQKLAPANKIGIFDLTKLSTEQTFLYFPSMLLRVMFAFSEFQDYQN